MIILFVMTIVIELGMLAFCLYGFTHPDFERKLIIFEDRKLKKIFKNYSGRDLGK